MSSSRSSAEASSFPTQTKRKEKLNPQTTRMIMTPLTQAATMIIPCNLWPHQKRLSSRHTLNGGDKRIDGGKSNHILRTTHKHIMQPNCLYHMYIRSLCPNIFTIYMITLQRAWLVTAVPFRSIWYLMWHVTLMTWLLTGTTPGKCSITTQLMYGNIASFEKVIRQS